MSIHPFFRARRNQRRYRNWPAWAIPWAKTIIREGKANGSNNVSRAGEGTGKIYNKTHDMALLDVLPASVRHAINYANFPMVAAMTVNLGDEKRIPADEMARRIIDFRGITPGSPSLAEFEMTAAAVDGKTRGHTEPPQSMTPKGDSQRVGEMKI